MSNAQSKQYPLDEIYTQQKEMREREYEVKKKKQQQQKPSAVCSLLLSL